MAFTSCNEAHRKGSSQRRPLGPPGNGKPNLGPVMELVFAAAKSGVIDDDYWGYHIIRFITFAKGGQGQSRFQRLVLVCSPNSDRFEAPARPSPGSSLFNCFQDWGPGAADSPGGRASKGSAKRVAIAGGIGQPGFAGVAVDPALLASDGRRTLGVRFLL